MRTSASVTAFLPSGQVFGDSSTRQHMSVYSASKDSMYYCCSVLLLQRILAVLETKELTPAVNWPRDALLTTSDLTGLVSYADGLLSEKPRRLRSCVWYSRRQSTLPSVRADARSKSQSLCTPHTSLRGEYYPLSYWCMRPSATSV